MRGEGFSGVDENLGHDIEEELRGSFQFIEASPGQWILRDRAGEYAARPASAPPPGPTLPLTSSNCFTVPSLIFTGMGGTDSLYADLRSWRPLLARMGRQSEFAAEREHLHGDARGLLNRRRPHSDSIRGVPSSYRAMARAHQL